MGTDSLLRQKTMHFGANLWRSDPRLMKNALFPFALESRTGAK